MKRRFERYKIDGQPERPEWWAVRPEEITRVVESVENGSTRSIAETPLRFPVHSVLFGPERSKRGTATWAIGSNSRNPASYKVEADDSLQTVALVCGVHGAEAEAVAGAANLISIVDTGADLRGTRRDRLLDLTSSYRLIVLPCVNMDGRSVSPDHLRGASMDEFVRASQGVWLSGDPVGYPACKEYAPLPLDEVKHPGGYPNGDGYNIMHDVCPGDMRTAEARAFLKLVAEEAADLILHFHSHSIGGQILPPPVLGYPFIARRTAAYARRVHAELEKSGLRPGPIHNAENRTGINLLTACQIASGGLSVCFEQPAVEEWSFEEMLETFYVVVETFLEHGRTEPFAPRDEVRKP